MAQRRNLVKITFPLSGQLKMKGKQCPPSSQKQSTNYTQQALGLDRVCLFSLSRERGSSEFQWVKLLISILSF